MQTALALLKSAAPIAHIDVLDIILPYLVKDHKHLSLYMSTSHSTGIKDSNIDSPCFCFVFSKR